MSSTKTQESPWFSNILELGPGHQPGFAWARVLNPSLHDRFTQQGGCKWSVVGAGGCGGVKMLFVSLTINGNDLCETSRDRSPGCEPVGVVLEAPLEPKSGLPIEPS